jgi:hypothetical protein
MRKIKTSAIMHYLIFPALVLCLCIQKSGLMDIGEGIPYPRTSSIIPLTAYSQWVYSHTAHDSAGSVTADLHCEIGRVYGLEYDTVLTPITEFNVEQKFTLYVYEHEWEDLASGILISYRDKNVDTTGIYIHGEYAGEKKTLYRKPILWLKYPAAVGDIWYRASPDSTDTLLPRYEVLDTNVVFSIPSQEEDLMSPVEFVHCHLYKSIKGDTVNYYHYTPQYGLVGFLEYINGILKRTCLLKSYRAP